MSVEKGLSRALLARRKEGVSPQRVFVGADDADRLLAWAASAGGDAFPKRYKEGGCFVLFEGVKVFLDESLAPGFCRVEGSRVE